MASGKTLQTTLEIGGVLSPSLQAAINKAVGNLNDMAAEALESADAASRLVAEMDAQEDVLKTLQKAYAGYAAKGEESSDQAQELANKIRTVSGELEENRSTLRAAEQAAARLTDSQEDAGDAYARLEKKIESQQSELASLRRQYANVALEQGESSAEARQLENRINSLSGELRENKQKLSEAEKAADDFGNALEDAGEKAADSSEGFTVMKGAISSLVADAIGKAIDAFKELAFEGENALSKLEAKTGASSSKMAGFEDVMYEVYNANYGESLGDVSDALSTVIQMTDDLDNKSLAKVTKNAIALEDVFGYDTTESMRAVNSLMDQFGITSDQAFNLVVQGAQNGLDQNGDLLDTINEYSVQFKNAGYSADDMFNMLANGTETGTWSVDKLGDAVKEFNIRMSDGTANEYLEELGVDTDDLMKKFNKGGPEAQQAIGTVMDAILKCDDATLQYQTGVGLFGTMWEDLGAETVASLMKTEGAIDSTSDAMAQMDAAAYDNLESSLSQLGRTIKAEVVQPIADKLIPVAKSAVDFINTKVGPAVDWLVENLPYIGIALAAVGAVIAAMKWSSIVAQVAKIAGTVVNFVTGIASSLAAVAAPVWIVIGVVAVLAAAFVNLWKNNEEFRSKITAIWEEIKGKFEAFGQAITDRLNALGFDFENITEVLGAVWDGFCNLLAPIFEGVFQQICNILGYVMDTFLGFFDIITGLFTGDWEMVWEGVKGVFGGVWDFIVNTFTNALDMLRGIADTVLGWFGTSWSEVWGSIKDFFVNTWNGIASFFSGIWEGITSACSTAWNGIVSFFTGALNGIKNVFTNVWNGITSFLSKAWETIKNVVQFGIMFVGSILSAAFQIITLPFRFIWENCKEYVFAAWEWIKEKVTTAINAVKSVITSVMNAIRSVISTVWSAVSSRVSAAVNAVKSVVSSVWNAIRSATSAAWNAVKGVISSVWNGIKSAVSAAVNTVKSVVTRVWNGIKSVTSSVWNGIKSAVSNVWNGIKSGVSNAVNSVKSTVSGVWNSIKSTAASVWNGIKSAMLKPIEAARDKIKGIVDAIKGFFSGMKLNLPKIKLPHFKVTGDLSLNPPSVPKLSIDWYKEGGIMTRPTIFGASGNTLMAGGEAGAEAILPLSVLWDKLEAVLRSIINGAASPGQLTAGEPTEAGLICKAGELLTLDDFSLGSLADGTNVVIYYDFSGFTWSPQIQNGKTGDDEDDIIARLKAHEAEFFDWLEEFIRMREVAQYA